MASEDAVRIASVQCGICEATWGDEDLATLAKRIARHWNHEHGDEFRFGGMEPFDRIELERHHAKDGVYAYEPVDLYVTAYDMLDTSGDACGPFAFEYVREPEAKDVCEDCLRPLSAVDGYRQVGERSWRETYRCDRCEREREIEQRENENNQLEDFA